MDRVPILPSTLEECQTFDRHGDGHVKCKQTLLPYSCPELRTHCLSSTLQRLDSHSAKTTTANTKTLSSQIGLISVVFVKESQYRFSGLSSQITSLSCSLSLNVNKPLTYMLVFSAPFFALHFMRYGFPVFFTLKSYVLNTCSDLCR